MRVFGVGRCQLFSFQKMLCVKLGVWYVLVRLCTTLHQVTQSLLLSASSAEEQLFGVCHLLPYSAVSKLP